MEHSNACWFKSRRSHHLFRHSFGPLGERFGMKRFWGSRRSQRICRDGTFQKQDFGQQETHQTLLHGVLPTPFRQFCGWLRNLCNAPPFRNPRMIRFPLQMPTNVMVSSMALTWCEVDFATIHGTDLGAKCGNDGVEASDEGFLEPIEGLKEEFCPAAARETCQKTREPSKFPTK